MKKAVFAISLLTFLSLAAGSCVTGQGRPDLRLIRAWNFEAGSASGWQPNDPGHWRIVEKEGNKVYELTAAGEQGKVRAPTSWSVWTGADRVKINLEPAGTSAARMRDLGWHAFKVVYEARSGDIRAYVDDMEKPALTARDRTLNHGLVGVGAFDDTGCFDDLRLRGLMR